MPVRNGGSTARWLTSWPAASWCTVACPVPPESRPRLRGARPGTAPPPLLPEPLVVTRRVSVRGSVMVGRQIQVGLAHARKTVQVTVGPDTYQITVEPGITVTAPRASGRDIRRHQASNYSPKLGPGACGSVCTSSRPSGGPSYCLMFSCTGLPVRLSSSVRSRSSSAPP